MTGNDDIDVINPQTGRKVLGTQMSDAPLGEVHVPFTKTADTCRAEAQCRVHIVPIVFVPGIMGSNLIGSVTNEKGEQVDAFAWAPDDMVGTVWHHINANPDTRQKALNPATTRVSYSVKKTPEIFEIPLSKEEKRNAQTVKNAKEKARKLAEKHGWGTVHSESYWPILTALHKLLNAGNPRDMIDPFDGKPSNVDAKSDKTDDNPKVVWNTLFNDAKIGYKSIEGLHMLKGEEATLTADEVKHAACYKYPVYAAGYNWLRSNYNSANGSDEWSLKNTIERIIKENQACDTTCDKVIIVTHSMGGLVTRAYSKENQGKALGVIHGVMPAVGAPPMYKRMRAGFGGIEVEETEGFLAKIMAAVTARVVGNDALETSAVLASCMGALELAPTMDYGRTNPVVRQWLRIQNTDGSKVSLPKADPYDEIYGTHHWYSLLPLLKDENPTEGRNTRVNPAGLDFNMSDLAYFAKNIRLARDFHTKHVPYDYYHPQSYVSYLAKLKAFETVTWKVVGGSRKDDYLLNNYDYGNPTSLPSNRLEPMTETDVAEHVLLKDSTQGRLDIGHGGQVKYVEVQGQGDKSKGDGTVPEDSGKAPLPFVKAIFEQGDDEHDHQFSWDVSAVRRMALYSVIQLMKQDERVKS